MCRQVRSDYFIQPELSASRFNAKHLPTRGSAARSSRRHDFCPRFEFGSLYRFTVCTRSHHRCEMAFNSRIERDCGPAGNGIAGLVSANAASAAPLWPSSSKQTYSLRKEPRCLSEESAPRCALLADDRDRALSDRWLCGSIHMESGSKQLGHELRRLAFARLATGAARGLGRRSDPCPSDVSLTLLRSRALAGKGLERFLPRLCRTILRIRASLASTRVPGAPAAGRAPATSSVVNYLVDPASSHMLVSKIKPCMSKYKLLIL
jgi:hypothetical protein